MSKAGSSGTSATQSSSDSPRDDDWSSVSDPNERRRIQNRIAQRKFREKARQQREEDERSAQNEIHAAAAYTAPDPTYIIDYNEPGLPWGSLSWRHIIESGRIKEQNSTRTPWPAAGPQGGGSTRVGLHLIDQYARGSPVWAAWRAQTAPNTSQVPPTPPPPPPPLQQQIILTHHSF